MLVEIGILLASIAMPAITSVAPIWVWMAAAVLCFLSAPIVFFFPEIRKWCKGKSRVQEHHTVVNQTATNWYEFDELPLKYVACLWVGLPPTNESLRNPRVQKELTRLSLAVRQRKLEHPLGGIFYFWSIIARPSPNVTDDEFSKVALVQYAKNTNRPIPDFLKPTLEKQKEHQGRKPSDGR